MNGNLGARAYRKAETAVDYSKTGEASSSAAALCTKASGNIDDDFIVALCKRPAGKQCLAE